MTTEHSRQMNAWIRGRGRAQSPDQDDDSAAAAADEPVVTPSYDGGARTTMPAPKTPNEWLRGLLDEERYGPGGRVRRR